MNIAQLLHKLRVISNVEIVVPLLPEMLGGWPTQARFWLEWGSSKQTPGYSLLQRLQRIGQRALLWFAEQEVNMLGHDYVPVNLKPEAAPHALQGGLEDSSAGVGGEQRTAMVAAERDEVTLPAVVKTRESPSHEDNLVLFTAVSL
jgi:hypothetical protein